METTKKLTPAQVTLLRNLQAIDRKAGTMPIYGYREVRIGGYSSPNVYVQVKALEGAGLLKKGEWSPYRNDALVELTEAGRAYDTTPSTLTTYYAVDGWVMDVEDIKMVEIERSTEEFHIATDGKKHRYRNYPSYASITTYHPTHAEAVLHVANNVENHKGLNKLRAAESEIEEAGRKIESLKRDIERLTAEIPALKEKTVEAKALADKIRATVKPATD